ncbi:MAG: Uncharacterized protein Greene101449_918 [Candidatus Peregrinibacteria bacterium Greene1014_49]|nr:MAG: Uncharacterized protein Greene101449_918 [Candidatus Peregrinibacteria bacterium Greene1014_49]
MLRHKRTQETLCAANRCAYSVPMSFLSNTLDSVLKRIRRHPLYYGRYNNTLPFKENRAFVRYAKACATSYASEHGDQHLPPSPLLTNGGQLVQGIFPAEKALAYSRKIDDLIARNDPCVDRPKKVEHLTALIKDPLHSLGMDLLDALKSPVADQALRSFFRGYYRVKWVVCYRSLPAQQVTSSWLWHSDSFPPHTCKMFLHLSESTADSGAMELMTLEDTMAYRRAGYFGQFADERYAGLEDFAKAHKLPYRPFHFDAKPGDGTIFDMNFFHRAVPPRPGHFRDVVQFYFLPSSIPWEKQLELDGVANLTSQGGYPKDPRPGASQTSSQSTMM